MITVSHPLFPKNIQTSLADCIWAMHDNHCCCCKSQDYFEDPVTAADDYNYERYAITDWLSKHNTSPMTNLALSHHRLTPNSNFKIAMQALLQQLSPAKQVEVASYLS